MKCSLCHGPLVLLGYLGETKQLRCRACGMIFSRSPKPPKKPKQEKGEQP